MYLLFINVVFVAFAIWPGCISAYMLPRNFIWLRVHGLRSNRRAYRLYYDLLRMTKDTMINNRETLSKNAIKQTVSFETWTTRGAKNVNDNVVSGARLTMHRSEYAKDNKIDEPQVTTHKTENANDKLDPDTQLTIQDPKNTTGNTQSDTHMTAQEEKNTKDNRQYYGKSTTHVPMDAKGNTVSDRKLTLYTSTDYRVAEEHLTGKESQNANENIDSNVQWTTHRPNSVKDNIVSNEQSTRHDSNETKTNLLSNRYSTERASKTRHRHKVKLATRYGYFWVSADELFRRPFDILASGIIG